MKRTILKIGGVILLLTGTFTGCILGFNILPEYHTQEFEAGQATRLGGKQIYFTSESFYTEKLTRPAHYERIVSEQSALPVNPVDHQVMDFSVADPFALLLPEGTEVAYYGWLYSTLYIASDGTIAFGTPGTGNGNLAEHFSSFQLSLLPVDVTADGGRVSYAIYEDNIVITFENVGGSTFQCEFFLQGEQRHDMAFTYPNVGRNTRSGVVGLGTDERNFQLGNDAGLEDFLERSFVESDLLMDSQFANTGSMKLGLGQ